MRERDVPSAIAADVGQFARREPCTHCSVIRPAKRCIRVRRCETERCSGTFRFQTARADHVITKPLLLPLPRSFRSPVLRGGVHVPTVPCAESSTCTVPRLRAGHTARRAHMCPASFPLFEFPLFELPSRTPIRQLCVSAKAARSSPLPLPSRPAAHARPHRTPHQAIVPLALALSNKTVRCHACPCHHRHEIPPRCGSKPRSPQVPRCHPMPPAAACSSRTPPTGSRRTP